MFLEVNQIMAGTSYHSTMISPTNTLVSGDFGAPRPSSLSPTLPSPTGDIAERVHRIEALLGPRDTSPTKNLWFYKVIKTYT